MGAAASTAPVHANSSLHNGDTGIFISNGAAADLVDNLVTDNKNNGIVFQDANGVADSNRCVRNAGAGIQISGAASKPEVRRNDCNSNLWYGIVAFRGAAGVIELNLCELNGAIGIYVADPETKPRIAGNIFRKQNKDAQLVVGGGAAPQIAEEDKAYLQIITEGASTSPAAEGKMEPKVAKSKTRSVESAPSSTPAANPAKPRGPAGLVPFFIPAERTPPPRPRKPAETKE